MDIVRKVTSTRRELWIAREVSCNSSEAVAVPYRLSNETGQDAEFLMELASGSNGQTWQSTYGKELHGWVIAVRPLHSSFGGPGGLCVKNGDVRGTLGDPLSDA